MSQGSDDEAIKRISLWLKDVAVISGENRNIVESNLENHEQKPLQNFDSKAEKFTIENRSNRVEKNHAGESPWNNYLHFINESEAEASIDIWPHGLYDFGIASKRDQSNSPHSSHNERESNSQPTGHETEAFQRASSYHADPFFNPQARELEAEMTVLDVEGLINEDGGHFINEQGMVDLSNIEMMDTDDCSSENDRSISWRNLIRRSANIIGCSLLSMIIVIAVMILLIALVVYEHIPSHKNG